MNINNRVYVIYSFNEQEGEVQVFGMGTYLCKEVPDDSAVGVMADFCREAKKEVPKIRLDTGDIIWGCECYFDSETEIERLIRGKKITRVEIKDLRDEYKRADKKD